MKPFNVQIAFPALSIVNEEKTLCMKLGIRADKDLLHSFSLFSADEHASFYMDDETLNMLADNFYNMYQIIKNKSLKGAF